MTTPTLIGQNIGPYMIKRLIGTGGMGIVYEAIHNVIGRRFAIKILSGKYLNDEIVQKRFFHEATVGRWIESPWLVAVIDYGLLPSGEPYIVMDYVDGESLRHYLERLPAKRLSTAETVFIGWQVAKALSLAHMHRIVHRDLKPENIMLVHDEALQTGRRVRVLDFGIAKFLDEPDMATGPMSPQMGTLTYMSPEQCNAAADVGEHSDVYALGVLLYEMLLGRPPFVGSKSQLMFQHVFQQPSFLGEELPGVSDELTGLILCMLNKAAKARPSMMEVAQRLEKVSAASGTPLLAKEWPAPPAAATSGARPPAESTHDAGTTLDAPGAAPAPAAAPPPNAVKAEPTAMGISEILQGQRGANRSTLARLGSRNTWLVIGSLVSVLLVILNIPRSRSVSGEVRLPAGRFLMGSSSDEIAAAFDWARLTGCARCSKELYEREQPQRYVQVSTFALDAFEVTNQAFVDWLNGQHEITVAGRIVQDREQQLILDLYPSQGTGGILYQDGRFIVRRGMERMPVTYVSWLASQRYCEAHGQRLPTEVEWEYAARGEERRRYPWGDDEPDCAGVSFGRQPDSGTCMAQGLGLMAVGRARKDQTPLGIHDLGGNVAEWTLDRFHDRYALCPGSCLDPIAEGSDARDGSVERVVRGGTWYRAVEAVRSAARSRRKGSDVSGDIGFRCARPLARATGP